ncbi:MAG: RICIN domain-containing protein [Streptosporangiaceae bacterium]|jgi:hypothetical protein
MVTVVPPGTDGGGLDGAASVNSAGNQVSVIFGGGSGSTAVTVNGLSSLPGFGGTAHVILEQTVSAGRTTAVAGPDIVSAGSYPITGGSITVPVSAMNAANGYHLLITPGTSSALSGTYVIKNTASGLLLGISNEGISDGADALIWGDNGTSDHLWQVVPAGSGQYKIENYNSGLVLGVLNESKSSGAQVLQWDDNGTPDHLWTLTAS